MKQSTIQILMTLTGFVGTGLLLCGETIAENSSVIAYAVALIVVSELGWMKE